MTPVRRATAAAATLGVAAAVGLGGCGTARHTGAGNAAPLTRFDEQGVTVTVAMVQGTGAAATLEVTFAPDRPGFHLYSADLPPDGVDGVGRPLTIAAGGVLRDAGRPTTDVPAHMLSLQGADMAVPVYPDGPVTAALPVTITGSGAADLSVGYAACSETECLPPVTGHRIGLLVSGNVVTSTT